MAAPLLALVPGIVDLIGKFIPDKQKAAEMQLELARMQQDGELKALDADLQVALAQAATNQAEAASSCAFRGSWRPAVGWVCVVALAYQFLLQPLLAWGSTMAEIPVPPTLELGDLIMILTGMLGLGGFRTYERVKGAIPRGR